MHASLLLSLLGWVNELSTLSMALAAVRLGVCDGLESRCKRFNKLAGCL